VDPEVEAAVNHDNVLICCTKSFDGHDNIGTTWSYDGGDSWTYLFSLNGYTTTNEFGVALHANPGGASWHLAFNRMNSCFYSAAPQDGSDYFQAVPDLVDDAACASIVYPQKGITSSWETDCPGIAWADYRDGTPDYDVYFDRVDDPARIYVPEEYGTIQEALLASTTGQIIHVNEGTYHENVCFWGNATRLQSVFGPEKTVIDGGQAGTVISFVWGEGPDSVIEGFTLRNGSTRGITCNASDPQIIGNIIRDNASSNSGAGISVTTGATPVIIGNWILDNDANEGGGLFIQNSNPLILNNVLAGNYANVRGGAVFCDNGPANILSNTFAGNLSGTAAGGLFVMGSSKPAVRSSIFWGNQSPTHPQIYINSPANEVTFTDVQGGWPGQGCIDADPLFEDQLGGDYRLKRFSPCINMGDPAYAGSFDIAWNHRPGMGTPDMGAYEFTGSHALSADAFFIDQLEGAVIDLDLDAYKEGSGRPYLILGGVSGTWPGVPLPKAGPTLPLNLDIFTDMVMELCNTPVFVNFMGVLDWNGKASAKIDTLGPLPGSMADVRMSFAYACPYKSGYGWFASNPVTIVVQ